MISSKNWALQRAVRVTAAAVLLTFAQSFARGQGAEDVSDQLSTATTAPYSLFNYASLTGSGNTVTANWVPVVLSDGKTIYKSVTLLFNVDASGNLTIASGYPHVINAPVMLVSSFKAGSYVGPSTILGGTAYITVSGPGATTGGATEWSLAAGPGANGCTYPDTATWYDGPLTSNPLYPRIKAAGITSNAWSYGVGEANCYLQWAYNPLIGVSQIGNSLTIVSFSNNGVDYKEPQATITYELK